VPIQCILSKFEGEQPHKRTKYGIQHLAKGVIGPDSEEKCHATETFQPLFIGHSRCVISGGLECMQPGKKSDFGQFFV